MIQDPLELGLQVFSRVFKLSFPEGEWSGPETDGKSDVVLATIAFCFNQILFFVNGETLSAYTLCTFIVVCSTLCY